MFWAIAVGVAIVAIAFLGVYLIWGLTSFAIFSAFILAFLMLGLFYRFFVVHLNEVEVGVIFKRDGNFSRFLPPKNTYFLQPYEYLSDKMTTGPRKARGTTSMIRTKEGIPITIAWEVSFRIDPSLIPNRV